MLWLQRIGPTIIRRRANEKGTLTGHCGVDIIILAEVDLKTLNRRSVLGCVIASGVYASDQKGASALDLQLKDVSWLPTVHDGALAAEQKLLKETSDLGVVNLLVTGGRRHCP